MHWVITSLQRFGAMFYALFQKSDWSAGPVLVTVIFNIKFNNNFLYKFALKKWSLRKRRKVHFFFFSLTDFRFPFLYFPLCPALDEKVFSPKKFEKCTYFGKEKYRKEAERKHVLFHCGFSNKYITHGCTLRIIHTHMHTPVRVFCAREMSEKYTHFLSF